GRAFAAPRAQPTLGLARPRRAPGQQLERLRADVAAGGLGRAREDELDAVAGRKIRELAERIAARERAEPLGELPVVQREVGETFRAALAPRHADHGKMIEHERRLESGADACMDSRTAPLLCHGSVTADPEV